MSKKLTNRLLSFVLSLAMICSLVVTPVFAAGDTTSETASNTASIDSAAFKTITVEEVEAVDVSADSDEPEEVAEESVAAAAEEAISGAAAVADTDDADSDSTELETLVSVAEAGSTITLSQDVTVSSPLAIDKELTIDLNGHTIAQDSSFNGSYLLFVTKPLTIKDSAGGGSITTATTFGVAVSGGTLTMTGGSITNTSGRAVHVQSSGVATLSDVTLSGSTYGIYNNSGVTDAVSVSGASSISGATGIYNLSGGTTVTGTCTVSGTTYGIRNIGGTTEVSGSANVSGESIGALVSAGELTITAGTVTSTNRGVEITGGTLYVKGGTITGDYYGLLSFGGTSFVSDGNITGTSYYGVYVSNTSVAGTVLTISGGSVNGAIGIVMYAGGVDITGGTISGTSAGVYANTVDSVLTVGEENADNSAVTITSDEDAIYLNSAAIATVKSGTISAAASESAAAAGITVIGNSVNTTPTTLTVEGGEISGVAYGIVGNGSASYSDVTITGGTVTGMYGIYHPECGDITIGGNAVIKGVSCGIELRAGNLTIEDSAKITSTATEFETQSNGSGTTVIGAAVAISQHTTKFDINVDITGGTLTGYTALYESNVQGNTFTEDEGSYEDCIDVNISGGKFYANNAAGYAVSGTSADTVAITGGYFSTDPTAYVVSGYNVATDESQAPYIYFVTDDRIIDVGMDIGSGIIALKFYIGAKDTDETDEDSQPTVTIDGTAVTLGTSQTVSGYDQECYIVTLNVSPEKMVDEHTIVVTYSNGYSLAKTTSVKEYVDTFLAEEGAEDTVEGQVLIALLNYGAMAQLYTNYETSTLANENHVTDLSSVTASSLSDYRYIEDSSSDLNLTYVSSYNMTFDSNFVFTMIFDKDISGYDVSLSFVNSEADVEYSIDGANLSVTLDGFQLDDQIQVTVKSSDSEYRFTIYGLTFARSILRSSSSSTELTNLCRAVYLYSVALSNYEGSDTMESAYTEAEITVVSLDDEVDVVTSEGTTIPSGGRFDAGAEACRGDRNRPLTSALFGSLNLN